MVIRVRYGVEPSPEICERAFCKTSGRPWRNFNTLPEVKHRSGGHAYARDVMAPDRWTVGRYNFDLRGFREHPGRRT